MFGFTPHQQHISILLLLTTQSPSTSLRQIISWRNSWQQDTQQPLWSTQQSSSDSCSPQSTVERHINVNVACAPVDIQSTVDRKPIDVIENDDSNVSENTLEIKAVSTQTSIRLPRSERKAQERARKQRHRQPNQSDNVAIQKRLHNHHESYKSDNLLMALKRAQNNLDVDELQVIYQYLLQNNEHDASTNNWWGTVVSRLIIAALHLQCHDIASHALELRMQKVSILSRVPSESASLIRALLRTHNVSAAVTILDEELPLPNNAITVLPTAQVKELLLLRSSSLLLVASYHFAHGDAMQAISACEELSAMGPLVEQSGLVASDLNGLSWDRLIRDASHCESLRRRNRVTTSSTHFAETEAQSSLPCNVVYSALDAILYFPTKLNDQAYEALANSLVRRVVFVAGAVSVDNFPPSDRGEVAFIGRSNVGKSSLLNMVTNRKSLAFTSKTPGKTQQFNFFAVNDKVGREREIRYGDTVDTIKDLDSFYLVDLPGFGYAKVPDSVKEKWALLMNQYIATRPSLRVLFHLIDARHGPTEDDIAVMQKVKFTLPSHARYVVVLTKADKNTKRDSTTNAGAVSSKVLNAVNHAMQQNSLSGCAVLVTSAKNKLGRDSVWQYLRRAAES
jgi:GTP-binding protein